LARQQIKIAHRLKKRLLLIYSGHGYLKWINDTLGHKEGDRALEGNGRDHEQHVSGFRFGARMGGDEFAVLGLEESEADFY